MDKKDENEVNRSKFKNLTFIARHNHERQLERNIKEWVYRSENRIINMAENGTEMSCSVEISSIPDELKIKALKLLESREDMKGLTFEPSSEDLENDTVLCFDIRDIKVFWD